MQNHELQKEFLEKFNFTSENMNRDKLFFRYSLADEEVREMFTAMNLGDADGIVDALIDQIYIAYGTLNLLGIDIDKAFARVHAANMKKERGEKPRRYKMKQEYDVIKPEGWIAPTHRDNIGILKNLLEE